MNYARSVFCDKCGKVIKPRTEKINVIRFIKEKYGFKSKTIRCFHTECWEDLKL